MVPVIGIDREKVPRMCLSDYIRELLSREEYSFSVKDLICASGKSEIAIKRELARRVQKGDILNLRRGFYLILPPRYAQRRFLPCPLYVSKLFQFLQRPYYLGLYTAARYHGASHQQVHRDYIVTNLPSLSNIRKGSFDLGFYSVANWPTKNIQQRKSDAGFFQLSSPVLTAVDLVHHQGKMGGLNRLLPVLGELCEDMEPGDLTQLLAWYPYRSTLQRFGFLLETLNADNALITLLARRLRSTKIFPVLLSPEQGRSPGSTQNTWKVDVNIKLESDL